MSCNLQVNEMSISWSLTCIKAWWWQIKKGNWLVTSKPDFCLSSDVLRCLKKATEHTWCIPTYRSHTETCMHTHSQSLYYYMGVNVSHITIIQNSVLSHEKRQGRDKISWHKSLGLLFNTVGKRKRDIYAWGETLGCISICSSSLTINEGSSECNMDVNFAFWLQVHLWTHKHTYH